MHKGPPRRSGFEGPARPYMVLLFAFDGGDAGAVFLGLFFRLGMAYAHDSTDSPCSFTMDGSSGGCLRGIDWCLGGWQ